MKKVFEPKDLGLEGSFAGRGDIAAWEFDEKIKIHCCSACGNIIVGKPSHYCADCGSLMINAVKARAEYQDYLNSLETKGV